MELDFDSIAVATVEPVGGDPRDLFLRSLRPSTAAEAGNAANTKHLDYNRACVFALHVDYYSSLSRQFRADNMV